MNFSKYRKLVVLIIGVTSFSFSQAQSQYDFTVGLDTTALNHGIKSVKTLTIKVDSTGLLDTANTSMIHYLENGFVSRRENWNHDRYEAKSPMDFGHFWVNFTYNEKGYLIDENVHWGGPINVPGEYDESTVIRYSESKYVKGVLREDSVSVSNHSFSDDTWASGSIDFESSTSNKYDEQGKLIESRGDYATAKYKYDNDGLLKMIVHENPYRIYMRQEFEYEFYE